MKVLYIAAPYRTKTICSLQQNIHEARLMAQYYWTKNYIVICPHLNSANMDGLVPDERFLSGCLHILSLCDCMAMHPDWEKSAGCIKEHDQHRELKKEIFYPTWDEIMTVIDYL